MTENDRELELFNGDVGVVLSNGEGGLTAWFPDSGGAPSAFLPTPLPAHETAFTMTIHKSEGSQFERVLVWLPGEPSPVLTLELLHTAVTRARHRVTLVATEAAIRAALANPVQGLSGLRARPERLEQASCFPIC